MREIFLSLECGFLFFYLVSLHCQFIPFHSCPEESTQESSMWQRQEVTRETRLFLLHYCSYLCMQECTLGATRFEQTKEQLGGQFVHTLHLTPIRHKHLSLSSSTAVSHLPHSKTLSSFAFVFNSGKQHVVSISEYLFHTVLMHLPCTYLIPSKKSFSRPNSAVQKPKCTIV